ncbi:unnamed protein product [Paramecium sonneborni]|uniref:Uncharacterized protein n=1 Tax=Paramecium sonneborni TaxID=65129 RepID=A0A8S1RGB3_9CILI|nr:unnamed protein product [Paramecium sonneborni]
MTIYQKKENGTNRWSFIWVSIFLQFIIMELKIKNQRNQCICLSIKNYNRQKDEAYFFMQLMKKKMDYLQKDLNFINIIQVKIKCWGKLDFYKIKNQSLKVLEFFIKDSQYKQFFSKLTFKLNIYFSYNLTNELNNAQRINQKRVFLDNSLGLFNCVVSMNTFDSFFFQIYQIVKFYLFQINCTQFT